ncbi:hypothetical protein [Rhizobium sp. 9140]|uniref:hypothetical protein n=1 Tax=Rhizobium sp. 9140 TaxID=1761900 RepID=UPI000792E9A5|nr:hypothetical protein [Rhizobium sp. 9140]CZT38074.1 hypothetical protein GA0004734_00049490 [Rhizobium sp. 9140]
MPANSNDNTSEMSAGDISELKLKLYCLPGGTQDFITKYEPYEYCYSLHGWLLEVSALDGFKLVNSGSRRSEHATYIALPLSSNLGNLLGAMHVCSAPTALLFSLREIPDFDPDAPRWKSTVDFHVAEFVDTIANGAADHVLEWLRSCWDQVTASGHGDQAVSTADGPEQTSLTSQSRSRKDNV